ncbi:MAG TPA: ABC transporter permease subunit, partial [Anaerolineales bacterium]
LVWFLTRWALPQEETRRPGVGLRLARLLALLVAALAALMALYLVSDLASELGQAIAPRLGNAGFLGSFLANLGEILNILITTLAALAGGALLSSFAGRLGRSLLTGLKSGPRLAVNLFLGGLAGAVLFVLIGAGLNWLYEINDPIRTFYIPAIVGAALGLLAAILTRKEDSLPVGLAIYYITRTTLNALRAIEALVMVIVFVVWVGIGPFAGVLALSLHTIAALAKLYSEQVESISPGPLEAIKATGATRLQTIIYAVIPQIIPPYISFTMYRWDINVRMSTIIGFAGGGGIGFLLQQNINLSNYRAASAQMLAIAIVVALMDFLSSYLRERVV